jgi:hypothetical protein
MKIERIRTNPEIPRNSAAIAVFYRPKTILLYRHNYHYYVVVSNNFVNKESSIFLIHFSNNAEKKDCLKKGNLKNFLERFFNDYVDL